MTRQRTGRRTTGRRTTGRRTTVALLASSALTAVASGVLAAAVVPLAVAEERPGAAFLGYSLTAQAVGFQATEDQPTATTHPEGEGEVPLAQVSLGSGPVGYALSSIAWPGPLVANAGALLVLAGAPIDQDTANALNSPVRAETRTGGEPSVTNDSVPGAVMRAAVDAARAVADSEVDGGEAGRTIGFGRTTVSGSAVLAARTATSSAASTVKDLEVADGVVTLDGLTSTATATTDGASATGSGRTVVSGLRIAGVPVVVDGTGVTVDSTQAPLDPTLTSTVDTALAQLGMTVLLSEPTQSVEGGAISYDAGSLIITWRPPSTPSTVTVVLGGSRVTASAQPADPVAVETLPPVVGSVPGAPPTAPRFDPVAPQPVVGSVPGPVAAPAAPAAPVVAPRAVVGRTVAAVLSGETAPVGAALLAVLASGLLVAGMLRLPALLAAPRPVCPTSTRSFR